MNGLFIEAKHEKTAEEKQRIAEQLLAKNAHGNQAYLQKTGKVKREKRMVKNKKK